MNNHNDQITPVQTTQRPVEILDTAHLNQLLRQQLSPSNAVKQIDSKVSKGLSQVDLSLASDQAVTCMLSETKLPRAQLHKQLSKLYLQQKTVYDYAPIEPKLKKKQYISASGLIMSPDNCVTTQLDDLRVQAFARGIDQALSEKLPSHQGPFHIVYPACGPFAPLLLPLIAYYHRQQKYSAEQLQVTLIDVQEGAVQSLQALVHAMGLKDYIRRIECIDALTFQPENMTVDMVVLEAMQHGVSSEGHFLIARHFASLLSPDGCFIPQKISVKAILNIAQRELVEQWQNSECLSETAMDPAVKEQRIDLGEVVSLSAESLQTLPEIVLDANTRLIECDKVTIPDLPSDAPEYTLFLCTQVQVFADQYVGEYDSGITHPLPDLQVCINFIPRESRPGDLLLRSGESIQFYYRLNGLPGFFAACCAEEGNNV